MRGLFNKGDNMKTINLGHKDMDKAMKELKKYPGADLGYANGSIVIEFPVVEKKVETKKVVKTGFS